MPPIADEELRALAALVREQRLSLGLSQERLGLEGGLGRKYVGQVERGELMPTLKGIKGITQGLGMTPAAFLRALANRLDEHDAPR